VIGELGEKIRQLFIEVDAPLPEPDASLF